MGFVPAVTHIFNIYGNHGACDAESLLRKMRNFAGTAGITVVRLRREERCLSMTVSCRNRWHASNIAAAGNMVLFMRKNYTGIMGAGSNKPVPVHPARYRRRGYNQAEILARHFGKLSGLPVGTEMIARIKDTRPQKELSAGERKRNLAGAFSVGRQVRELNQIPECVIIMDDIYTTGSTMEACSAVLKETGIRRIYFLCVCIGQGN